MKSRVIFFFLLLVCLVISSNADERGPIAVSPGSDVGMAVINEYCPTFSWASVEWAIGYRIAVFESTSAEVLSYDQLAAVAYPVLSKDIPGRALSWTPSSDERLNNQGMYVWYVQAMDAYGTVKWSEGKVFKIEAVDRLQKIGEKLSEALKERGLNEEAISDVLSEIDSELDEGNRGEAGPKSNGYKTQDKIEIQGWDSNWNTWYGNLAGASLDTDAYANSFFGYRAGYKTNNGDYNTFIGYETGHENTSGMRNTFLGYYSGRANITGYNNIFLGYGAGYKTSSGYSNTFLGYLPGHDNTTGNENTYIGYQAGYKNISGNGNIYLGSNAGYWASGSNKLYIDNSSTFYPLIYGEFDNDIIAINGKLGVGTQWPNALLEIVNPSGRSDLVLNRNDGATFAFEAKLNNVRFGSLTAHALKLIVGGYPKATFNADGSLEMISGATCTAAGVWTDASSRAYKENIQNLTVVEAKDALSELNPVRYNYKKDKDEEYLGFIAEDVPELVASKDRKGMSPMDVVAVLTKVVQEQQGIITELQERIAKLEKTAR